VQFEASIPYCAAIQRHESSLIDECLLYDDQGLHRQELDVAAEWLAKDEKKRRKKKTAKTAITASIRSFADVVDNKGNWQRIPNTVQSTVEYFQKIESDSSAWAKGTTIVDASAAHAFATQWNLSSYARERQHFRRESKGALFQVTNVENSHSMLYANRFSMGLAISSRVFKTWFTWRRDEDGSFVIAYAPLEKFMSAVGGTSVGSSASATIDCALALDAAAATAVVAKVKGFWRFRPLAPSVCRITYLIQGDLGGSIPRAIMNMRLKSMLRTLQRIQDGFSRKEALVDAEMRDAFPAPPPLVDLNGEQREVIEDGRALESDAAWEPLPSTSPAVEMWVQYNSAGKNTGSTIGTGKACATADCSALCAMAWWFAFESRENMRISVEQGNPARVRLRQNSPHDLVAATIINMPFPRHKREFVSHTVCAVDQNADLVVAGVPFDEAVDYGHRYNTRRARSKNFLRFTSLAGLQCKVTFYNYLDGGGRLPKALTNTKIPQALRRVVDLCNFFCRDDEIDDIEREKLTRIFRDETVGDVTAEDSALLSLVEDKLGALKDDNFEELDSPDFLVRMGLSMKGDSAGTARASTIVDASPEECAAWEIMKTSREQMKRRNIVRTLTRVNSHKNIFYTVRSFGVPTVCPREWITSQIWKVKDQKKIVVAYESHDGLEAYPLNPAYVRAKTSSYLTFERLENEGERSRTLFNVAHAVGLGGNIPKFVQTKSAGKFLASLSELRRRFDKSSEIDAEVRARNVEMITNSGEEHDGYERTLLFQGEEYFTVFNGLAAKTIKLASPLTQAKIVYLKNDSKARGWASTTVRASPAEVLAYQWDSQGRDKRRADDLEKSVEGVSDHNQLVYNLKKTPKVIANRDFLSRVLWRREADGSFLYVSVPEKSVERLPKKGVVRGKFPSAMRIKRKGEMETTIEYVRASERAGERAAS